VADFWSCLCMRIVRIDTVGIEDSIYYILSEGNANTSIISVCAFGRKNSHDSEAEAPAPRCQLSICFILSRALVSQKSGYLNHVIGISVFCQDHALSKLYATTLQHWSLERVVLPCMSDRFCRRRKLSFPGSALNVRNRGCIGHLFPGSFPRLFLDHGFLFLH
jgi:hypothetical protein